MTKLLTDFEEDDKFLERITNLDTLAKNEKKRCQIQDFEVDAKIPSMEARQQWRSSLTIVKNRARRFGMISNLDALDENEKRCQIQEKIQISLYIQKAALQFIHDHDTKTLTKSGGAEGRAQKVSVSLTEGVPSSELHIREKICGENRYAERPARSFLTRVWEAFQGCFSVPNRNLQHDNGVKTQNLVIRDDVWRKETFDRLCDIPGSSIFVVSQSNLTEPKATYVEMLREDEAICPVCRCASGQKFVPLGFSKSLVVKQVAPPQHQVFINFRGELRNNFISHLVDALKRNQINFFIDYQEPRGEDVNILLKRIEDSRIALVVFSSKYTQSNWCLKEAAKIKDCAEQGRLKVLPIFYKVTVGHVRQLKGEFGEHFRDRENEYRYRSDKHLIEIWKEALAYISGLLALTFDETSWESDLIGSIIKQLLTLLASIPSTSQSVSDRPRKAYYRRKMRINKHGLEIEQSRNEESTFTQRYSRLKRAGLMTWTEEYRAI